MHSEIHQLNIIIHDDSIMNEMYLYQPWQLEPPSTSRVSWQTQQLLLSLNVRAQMAR